MSGKKKKISPSRSAEVVWRRTPKVWLVAAFLIMLAGGVILLTKQIHTPKNHQDSGRRNETPMNDKMVFRTYAGSTSCRECHAEEFQSWQNSHHGLAERPVTTSVDGAAFTPSRTFRHGSQQTSVGYTNNAWEVTTLQATNQYETVRVERVLGTEPLRQFLVNFGNGRLQTLEAAYDPRSNEWFNVYGTEDRQPGEWGHWTGRGMNWNSMCATCHNTRVRKNYDEATDSYHTAAAESTVGCESCHGPLQAHVEWQQRKSKERDPTLRRLTRVQTFDNCGFCHSRRSDLTGDFKPGDNFFDQMRLATVDGTDIFYADGQVREEDYEFSAFLGSRMHFKGVVCSDCHNPHSAKTVLPGNWLCLRCHNGSQTNAPNINPSTHSHHRVFGFDTNGQPTNLDLLAYKPKEIQETGGECVNCHMPQTVYMQRHWRHDHGFTIPDPLVTKQSGIPNACNRCHQEKNVDWALEWVQKWYGSKMERPTRIRTQAIVAARAGDVRGRDALLSLLAREEIPYWRAVATGLLQSWASEPLVRDALLRELTNASGLVREASVRSLEPLLETDSERVGTVINQRLDDALRNVRVAAAWALRSQLDPRSHAASDLLRTLDFNADQPAGQMEKGVYALSHNDRELALAHYLKASEWDPNSALIHNDIGVVLASLGRGKEAVAHLEKACALEPRSAEYRYLLGLAYNETGQAAQTIDALQTAVKLDPRHGRAWYNLGLALNTSGRVEEGLDSLARAESATPTDARIPYARATILAQLGRKSEARQAVQRALELQADYAPAAELLRSLR